MNDTLNYGEVQFFFQATIEYQVKTLALVSTYSPPNIRLLHHSMETVWSCRYQGIDGLTVIDVESIRSAVAMPPLPHDDNFVFVGEKLGLEVANLGGVEEDTIDEP